MLKHKNGKTSPNDGEYYQLTPEDLRWLRRLKDTVWFKEQRKFLLANYLTTVMSHRNQAAVPLMIIEDHMLEDFFDLICFLEDVAELHEGE